MDKEIEMSLTKEKREKPTKEEIDKYISQIKAIWGIEGMEVKPEEEEDMRAYGEGRLTAEEFIGKLMENDYKSEK